MFFSPRQRTKLFLSSPKTTNCSLLSLCWVSFLDNWLYVLYLTKGRCLNRLFVVCRSGLYFFLDKRCGSHLFKSVKIFHGDFTWRARHVAVVDNEIFLTWHKFPDTPFSRDIKNNHTNFILNICIRIKNNDGLTLEIVMQKTELFLEPFWINTLWKTTNCDISLI